MVDWKKRLKKLAEDLDDAVPDEAVEDWVKDARDYLKNPTRVGKDVGKWAYNAPLIGGTRSPKQVREQYNKVTRKAVDPAREVTFAAVQERFNPRETVETLRERREQYGGLGAAFRARENTLAKRVTESALDPLNLIGFGTAGAGRAAGQSTARLALKQLAKGGLREIAAPAAGQVVGAEVGRRVGGERGAQIGELAGLLGGAVGPNIAGPLRETAAARVAESGGVGRMLTGETGEGPVVPTRRSSVRPMDERMFGGPAALSGAIQAGSTAAGAYGGYQAAEGEDWRTRAGATVLGGVAGFGLGRRVAQGKGIGLGIEDVGGGVDPAAAKRAGQQSFPGMDPKAERRGTLAIAGSVLDLARQGMLVGDIGQVARIGIPGFLNALSAGKPGGGALAFGRAVRGMVQPEYAKQWQQSSVGKRWADVAYPADLSNPEFGNLIQRIPGLGHLERMVFQRFTPIMAGEVAEAVFQGVKNHGDFKAMNDIQRRAVIGDWIKGMLVGRELDPEQTSVVSRGIARLAFLAPRWTMGQVQAVAKTADPGPEGELARRFWATTLLTAGALSVGLTAAMTGKDPRDLLNPTHPDSVVNPRVGRRFLAIEGPGGWMVSPFQPVMPVFRALMRPLAEGGQVLAEEGDILAAMEAMAGEGWDSGRDFLLGKASQPVRLFNDLVIRGTDFQGRPIITKEGIAGAGQAGLYMLRQNAPIIAQPLLERDPRVPGTEPTLLDRAAEIGTGFFGLTTRPPDRLPPDVASALRGAIEAKGGTPGADPDLISQYYGLKLDPSEKAALLREQPQLREFFEARTKLEGEKYEKPAGKARVKEYQAKKARLDMARRQALTDLEAENLTGNEYRRRRSELFDRHRGMVMGLQEAIFDTSDPERIDAAMDAVYRTGGEQSEEQKALDGLYSIQQEGESAEARTAYFEARKAYTESLSPEMREKLFQRQLDDAPTETERSLIRAQREYQERYMSLPQYRGIKQEDADAARPYIAMAADIQRVRPGLPFRAAIRLTKAPLKVQQTAIKIKSGRFTDPRRRSVFARSPLLSRWYSEIPGEILTQIAQPA